jgi:lysophospholipase L1-like esterase
MVRIACVGDSITYGFGLPAASRDALSYPGVLELNLPDFEVLNFGNNGKTMTKRGNDPYWNTDDYEKALTSNPDIVVLMLVPPPPPSPLHFAIVLTLHFSVCKGHERRPTAQQ